MDVRMPRGSGIEATEQIRRELPDAKILMLTTSDEEADLYEAIKAGASGYLLKEISIEEVPDAIRSVWAGQSRISPSMASKLLSEFAAMSQRTGAGQPGGAQLTPREMQVLELASRGLTNGEVAAGLNVSVHAVKFHLAAIYRKLGVANRTEAAGAYLRSSAGLNLPPSQLD